MGLLRSDNYTDAHDGTPTPLLRPARARRGADTPPTTATRSRRRAPQPLRPIPAEQHRTLSLKHGRDPCLGDGSRPQGQRSRTQPARLNTSRPQRRAAAGEGGSPLRTNSACPGWRAAGSSSATGAGSCFAVAQIVGAVAHVRRMRGTLIDSTLEPDSEPPLSVICLDCEAVAVGVLEPDDPAAAGCAASSGHRRSAGPLRTISRARARAARPSAVLAWSCSR
jgi:hypothetical protein